MQQKQNCLVRVLENDIVAVLCIFFLNIHASLPADTNECTEKANACPAQPSCVNSNGSYRCNCPSGWRDRGAHTCIDVDECLVGSHSCPSNSRCSNTPGSYRCICLTGWRNQGPSTCVDIDECSVGSHNCPSNSRCSNTIGSYLCRCKSGFTQPYSRSRCQDINECTTGSHSCSSYGNAYCVNTIGSYYCRCNRCYYMSGRSCNRKQYITLKISAFQPSIQPVISCLLSGELNWYHK